MTHHAFTECATNSENFVLVIAHLGNDKVRIDMLNARVPPFDPKRVIKDFSALLHERKIDTVMGGRYSSRWAVEAFARHGIAFQFCELERPDLQRDFLKLVDAKRVALPEHAELKHQLRTLMRRRVAHGGPDDLVTAVGGAALMVVGAVHGIKQGTPDYV